MEAEKKKCCGNCKYQKEGNATNDIKYLCDRYGIPLYACDMQKAYCECFQRKRRTSEFLPDVSAALQCKNHLLRDKYNCASAGSRKR